MEFFSSFEIKNKNNFYFCMDNLYFLNYYNINNLDSTIISINSIFSEYICFFFNLNSENKNIYIKSLIESLIDKIFLLILWN